MRRRHLHLRHRDPLALLQLILDELRARHHEQRLPDAEPDARDDAPEQPADAVHAHDVPHHRDHAAHGLTHVTERLRLDPRHLERVVPARQRPADDAGADFLRFGQPRVLVAVHRNLHPMTDKLGESLARRPVGGLSERYGGTARVERLQTASRVSLRDSFRQRNTRVVDGSGYQISAGSHDGDLRDASAGAREDAREGRAHAGAAEVIVDALLGVHQDHTLRSSGRVRFSVGWRDACLRGG